jgi:hypothetical protein
MPVVSGLVLDGPRSLSEVCGPLAAELSHCFWVVDLYSGPFRADWMFASAENEELAARQFLDIPAFANTSTHGFRPGTIPQLADHLILDEWSYYFAIDAPEDIALRRAGLLAGHVGDLGKDFLRGLDVAADLFICQVDGWWEFYTGRPAWFDRLLSAWPDCGIRPLERAGSPP